MLFQKIWVLSEPCCLHYSMDQANQIKTHLSYLDTSKFTMSLLLTRSVVASFGLFFLFWQGFWIILAYIGNINFGSRSQDRANYYFIKEDDHQWLSSLRGCALYTVKHHHESETVHPPPLCWEDNFRKKAAWGMSNFPLPGGWL